MKRYALLLFIFLSAIPSRAALSVVQHKPAFSNASATTVAVTISANSAGNLIAVLTGNNGTRTITGCSDNATGGSNTYVLSPANGHGVNGARETDACYILSAAHAGATTVTVTFSGSAGTFVKEAEVWEVSGFIACAFDIANNKNGTEATSVITGASVTTTSTTGFVAALVQESNTININPNTGNEFTSGGDIIPTSGDGAVSLISSTAAAHAPAWHTSSASTVYATSTVAFKEGPPLGEDELINPRLAMAASDYIVTVWAFAFGLCISLWKVRKNVPCWNSTNVSDDCVPGLRIMARDVHIPDGQSLHR